MRYALTIALIAATLAAAASAAMPPMRGDQGLASVHPRARLPASIDERATVVLAGNRHPALSGAQDLGPVSPSLRLERMILVLRSDAEQSAALDRFLGAEHAASVRRASHWLTPSEFEQHFGIAPADLTKITRWLRSHGFSIVEVPAGGRSIIFSGTAGQVQDAFHAPIHRYRVKGEDHVANSEDPRIPAALAPVVAGVASLHDFRLRPQHIAKPAYTSGSSHYLAPADFATIYDVNPLYSAGVNGSGRTIAVLGRSNVVASDISTFRSTMGLAANAPTVIVNGSNPGYVAGDETESDLDLEWSGAVAPSATIKFVTSASTKTTDGIDLSAEYAVSNNVADIITVSYAGCEQSLGSTELALYDSLWQQAAAQGTTVFVASGDAGAAGCDSPGSAEATGGLAVNGLCSTPYDVCVGGTEFNDTADPSEYWSSSNSSSLGSALAYIPEDVWNQSDLDGGTGLWSSGGGASTVYAKPFWQVGADIPKDGQRDVPDAALGASTHDGYLVYSSDTSNCSSPPCTYPLLLYVGGTSAATPSMAGIVALVDQQQGGRQGVVNPTLYGLSELQAWLGTQTYYHLLTLGNNIVESTSGDIGYAASAADPYYNQATGLGSVDANVLVTHWNDAAAYATIAPADAVVGASAGSGNATLTIASAAPALPWAASSNASWASVTPTGGSGSTTLSYTYQANTSSASRTATIGAGGQSLTLTQAAAAGSAPSFDAQPPALAFGTVTLGSASSLSVSVWNVGGSNLDLSSVQITGADAGDFQLSGTCGAGGIVASAASCTATVRFSPQAAGARAASLQIADNASGSPASIALSGTGSSSGGGGSGGGTASADVPLPPWTMVLLAGALGLGVARSVSGGGRRRARDRPVRP